ncbi:hypothetical protein KKG41_00125 [Patescibacteria group bacterium]|nr:hypothetical protein [Patescibacteria group bacterium]MBU1890558.1 hypothetical protein [Patescibacteria group bacterium]
MSFSRESGPSAEEMGINPDEMQVEPSSDMSENNTAPDHVNNQDQEIIADLVYANPEGYSNEQVAEVAIKDSEYAPCLVGELAKRRDHEQVLGVLNHYKDGPIFEHCVGKVEAQLSGGEDQDSFLLQLSESMRQAEGDAKPEGISDYTSEMAKRPERAARSLDNYLRLLGIDDDRVRDTLDKKSLLLVGGGTAPLKQGLTDRRIDCQLTNIDPMLTGNHEGNSDRPIAEDFYKVDADRLDQFDEVWAVNNSLPTYAFNPDQVRAFYQKSLGLVSENGNLKIMPVAGFKDSLTPAMRLNRVPTNNESLRCLESIKGRPDLFEIEEMESPPDKVAFGRKSTMKGVNIKVIGSQEQVRAFLREL